MRLGKGQRLADRVILSTLASGALGGMLAAVVTVVAVDRLVENHADTRLTGAANILEGEILEGFEEDEWEPLSEVVDDENGELVTSGIRLAVFSDGHRIAGDPWVPEVAAGRCETRGAVGERVRACGRTYWDWVLVAASASDEAGLRVVYVAASLTALLLGGLVGGLASARLTRWALQPLRNLEGSIRRMRADKLDTAALLRPGPGDACAEVSVIRVAPGRPRRPRPRPARPRAALRRPGRTRAAHAAHESAR